MNSPAPRIFLRSLGLLSLFLGWAATALAEETSPSTVLPVVTNDAAGFLKAMQKLKERRASGDSEPITIEIPPGVYRFSRRIELTPDDVAQGLTLKGMINPKRKEQVLFSGGIPLKKPAHDAQGHWRYKLPETWRKRTLPRLLVIDQKLTHPARHPNQGYLRIEKTLPDRRSGFFVTVGSLPDDFDPPKGMCDLIFLHDWSSSRLPVASYEPSTRVLRTLGPIGCKAPHYAIDHFEKHPRFYLEGHPLFADQPGEWYVDLRTNEIVLVSAGADRAAPDVVLPQLVEILVASGTEETPLQNFILQGITFTETEFPMPPGGYAASQATSHEPRDRKGNRKPNMRLFLPAAVRIDRAEGCFVMDCRFRQLGGAALWLGSRTRHCRATRCHIAHVGGNGIHLGEDRSRLVNGKAWYQVAPEQVPTANRIEQCEISFCGEMLPGAVGIWAGFQKQLVIIKNFLHDLPYTGVSLGWMWNESPTPAGENKIQGNRIEFVMRTLSDGGGIYTLGRQPGSVIEDNVISDIRLNAGRAESNGMFLDEGTTGFLIRRNTIRRVAKSPLRFHRAGKNEAVQNRWELATSTTPPVRYNATPESNITLRGNELLSPQKQIYLIGNSLTWDTIPPRLDERVLWHVDCGVSLKFIHDHPDAPCVPTSRIWPVALDSTKFDVLCMQPHYGKSLEEDVSVISRWIDLQPRAEILIHTGWARAKDIDKEWADQDPSGPPTHSNAYIDALLEQLRQRYPKRTIRSTRAMNFLHQVQQDISAGKAPFHTIEELYRDPIHMRQNTGRYLMHNVLRKSLGQPLQSEGFGKISPEVRAYFNRLLQE